MQFLLITLTFKNFSTCRKGISIDLTILHTRLIYICLRHIYNELHLYTPIIIFIKVKNIPYASNLRKIANK